MKTVILCGGKGSRMKEETEFKPKPLVEVGGRPILWHIMKLYAHHGFNDFVLALGYKGHMIKDYFLNHRVFTNDFTLHLPSRAVEWHGTGNDEFRITFVDTGVERETGGRILALKQHLAGEPFMVTYGDGVADIDLQKLASFHRSQGTLATITGAHPRAKYGLVNADSASGHATGFNQKPVHFDYINGGFMVFEPAALAYFDEEALENVFPKLIAEKQLSVYEHKGFWKAMDTYREMEELNELWQKDRPWAVWETK